MANLPLRTLPDASYLRERLDYNPETGVFIWRARPLEHFQNAALCGTWNTRYAGKSSGRKGILISARLYEELKDYLVMETDMTASNLLRRLRESNNG